MKRIFTAIAILGCIAMMAHADSNTVTSVNVVGYNKADIPATGQFNLIGVQFDAFDATLLGVFGTNQLTAAAFPWDADNIYIYDPGIGAAGGYMQYAMKSDDMQFYDINSWFGGSPTNPAIDAGTGMWVQSAPTADSNEVVIAGEVVDVATQSIDIVEGFQILSYPYSTEIPINDTSLGDNATGATMPWDADNIYIWNGIAYDQYALNSNDGQWYDVNQWFGGAPTTDTFPMGAGFWFEANTGFMWEEPIPYEDALE